MAEEVLTETPGNVWKVLVKPGDKVDAGTTLFIMEVMKTEVPHNAASAGTVRAVHITEGQEGVDAGIVAVELDSAAQDSATRTTTGEILMAQQQGIAHATLADALWSPAAGSPAVRAIALAVIGRHPAHPLGQEIQVPFWPVPMTMQTFVVLVLGVAYGWRLAGATVLLVSRPRRARPAGVRGRRRPRLYGRPDRRLSRRLPARCGRGRLAGRARLGSLGGEHARGAWLIGTAIIFACGIAWLSTLIGLPQAINAGLIAVPAERGGQDRARDRARAVCMAAAAAKLMADCTEK